jgi:hypothetical protein
MMDSNLRTRNFYRAGKGFIIAKRISGKLYSNDTPVYFMLKFKISHCWNRIYCQMQGTSQSANLFI